MTFFFTLLPNLSADILARCVAQKWSPHLQKISALTKFKSVNLTWKKSPLIPNNIKDSKFKNLRKSRNKRNTEPNTWDQRYQNPINLVGYSQSKPIKTFHMSKVGFIFFPYDSNKTSWTGPTSPGAWLRHRNTSSSDIFLGSPGGKRGNPV